MFRKTLNKFKLNDTRKPELETIPNKDFGELSGSNFKEEKTESKTFSKKLRVEDDEFLRALSRIRCP